MNLLLLAAILIYSSCQAAKPHCIWYGHGAKEKNKVYNGTAKRLVDKKAIETLNNLCPDLVPDMSNVLTCCDSGQINLFSRRLDAAKALLSRCPPCLKNFQKLFCHLTCSPQQSDFLVVTGYDFNDRNLVDKITYYISSTYINSTFASCKDTQNPSSGDKALNLMCGKDIVQCTPTAWLKFIGSRDVAPFQIDFNITAKEVVVRNITYHPMNASTSPCTNVCSCQDCETSCSPEKPCPVQYQRLIFGYDEIYIATAFAFVIFLVVFTLILLSSTCVSVLGRYKLSTNKSVMIQSDTESEISASSSSCSFKSILPNLSNPTCMEKLQVKVEEFLEKTFAKWGRFCAKRRWLVVVASIIICVAMTSGIFRFRVVTDPVELWSSPDSQAKKKKVPTATLR